MTTLELTVELEEGGWANLLLEGHFMRGYTIGHKVLLSNDVLMEVTDVWHSVRISKQRRAISDRSLDKRKPNVIWLKGVEPISEEKYQELLEMGFEVVVRAVPNV